MKDYSINLTEVGQRIKFLRLKQRKNQVYFADMLFISPSYLALIENGKRTPTIDVLAQIAKTCDVSIVYLLYGNSSYDYDSTHLVLQRLLNNYPKNMVEKTLSLAEYYLKLESDDTPG